MGARGADDRVQQWEKKKKCIFFSPLRSYRLLEPGGVVLVDAARVVELDEHLTSLHLRVVHLDLRLLLEEGLAHKHLVRDRGAKRKKSSAHHQRRGLHTNTYST